MTLSVAPTSYDKEVQSRVTKWNSDWPIPLSGLYIPISSLPSPFQSPMTGKSVEVPKFTVFPLKVNSAVLELKIPVMSPFPLKFPDRGIIVLSVITKLYISDSAPLNISKSTLPTIPETLPLSLYCQKTQLSQIPVSGETSESYVQCAIQRSLFETDSSK